MNSIKMKMDATEPETMRRKKRKRSAVRAAVGMLCRAQMAMAADEVQLVDASSRVNSYRGPALQSLTADILVKNLGPAKKVGIRYRNHKGAWVDAFGTFQYATGDGRERWQVSAYPCNSFYETDCGMTDPDFAVQMQVNGQSYWDNNGGT